METISIITNRNIIEEFRRQLNDKKFNIEFYTNSIHGLTIHDDKDHIRIEGPFMDGLIYYEDKTESNKITNKFKGPFFYYLNYASVKLVKELALILLDDRELLIDNDFGLLVPGNEFVELIKKNPGWDWREK